MSKAQELIESVVDEASKVGTPKDLLRLAKRWPITFTGKKRMGGKYGHEEYFFQGDDEDDAEDFAIELMDTYRGFEYELHGGGSVSVAYVPWIAPDQR